jgi:hypothetical protein
MEQLDTLLARADAAISASKRLAEQNRNVKTVTKKLLRQRFFISFHPKTTEFYSPFISESGSNSVSHCQPNAGDR